MSKKKKETPILADEMLSKSEAFVQKYKKAIVAITAIILLVVGGLMAYRNLVQEPKENEAASSLVYAQEYFAKDSFNLALNGDGINPGYIAIINEYSGTNAANIAYAEAGICYAQMNDYDKAIEMLEQYKGNSDERIISPTIKHLLGNCYSHKENYDKAIELILEAAEEASNIAITPYCLFEVAAMYEVKGNAIEANKLYERIKKEYPRSPIANEAAALIEATK